jgi:hypothetical protein
VLSLHEEAEWDLRAGNRLSSAGPPLLPAEAGEPAVSGTPASVKVRAAEAIFNQAGKAIEIEDIEARVSELERVAEAQKRKQ